MDLDKLKEEKKLRYIGKTICLSDDYARKLQGEYRGGLVKETDYYGEFLVTDATYERGDLDRCFLHVEGNNNNHVVPYAYDQQNAECILISEINFNDKSIIFI